MSGSSAGGGKSSNQSGPTKQSKQTQRTLFENLIGPIAPLFGQQLQSVLQTGRAGAQVPIAQQGVEATRSATSQALRGTQEGLAASGQINTPFGQEIIANQGQQGEVAANQVAFDIANDLFNQALTAIQGGGQINVAGGRRSSGQAKELQGGVG